MITLDNIKKLIVDNIAIYSATLILFGYLNLHSYYYFFGINIYNYLTTSEILLSFLPTLIRLILICCIIFMYIALMTAMLIFIDSGTKFTHLIGYRWMGKYKIYKIIIRILNFPIFRLNIIFSILIIILFYHPIVDYDISYPDAYSYILIILLLTYVNYIFIRINKLKLIRFRKVEFHMFTPVFKIYGDAINFQTIVKYILISSSLLLFFGIFYKKLL